MSIKLVKFSNGKFGVRRWSWISLEHQYKDLSITGDHYWVNKRSIFFRNCMTSEKVAREFFDKLNANNSKPSKVKNIEITDEVIE